MNKQEYKNIFKNESTHFYYVSLHNLVISLLKKYLISYNLHPTSKAGQASLISILDAGCGTGLLAKKLERFGKVVGIDKSREALKFAKKRGVTVKLGSVEKLPFKKNSFDVVCSIDVLYHSWVESDRKALTEFYRVLKPGGILIVRVPAISWLKLKHDEYVQGVRRYNKVDLTDKFKGCGFAIEKITYVGFILLFPAFIKYLLEQVVVPKKPDSNINSTPPFLNNILKYTFTIENQIALTAGLPVGVGLVAVGKKSKSL